MASSAVTGRMLMIAPSAASASTGASSRLAGRGADVVVTCPAHAASVIAERVRRPVPFGPESLTRVVGWSYREVTPEEVAMMKSLTVADVMTRDVVLVGEAEPYRSIIDLLTERRISAVPVVDAAGRVVGLVSEADLLHRVEFIGEEHERRVFERPARHEARVRSHAAVARDLMSTPAVTVAPDTPVARAARMMTSARVKRLPVVDEVGVLVGIVSRVDLLRMYVRGDDEIRQDVLAKVVHDAMWIDPDAVGVGVADGVVTLRGTVDRKSTAAILLRLTESVPGVIEVASQLAWERDDTDEVGSRFYRSHPFSASTEQPQ